MRIVGRLPMKRAVSCGQIAENAEKRAAPCIMTRSALHYWNVYRCRCATRN